MTDKKNGEGLPPNAARPKPKRTPGEVRKWLELQREMDEKLKELVYEDRNGFKPPKPWYED